MGNNPTPPPPGPGRPKGLPNKATVNAREAIAKFVDSNADRLTGWLDAIALKDPLAAFNAFMSVVEYHIPKLARQEINQKVELKYNQVEIVVKNESGDQAIPLEFAAKAKNSTTLTSH